MSPRLFAYRNCTDFVAWRLGITWGSLAFPGADGNARGWRQGAINSGYGVGTVPVVGAVAWWGTEVGAGFGHVAVVASVNGDGSANVEQYNYGGTGTYSITYNKRADAYLYINVSPPGQGVGDGAFVLVNETGEVYRMAGGAPVYVSSWNGFGGSQPVTHISQAQLNAMPAYPRDGTFLNTTAGGVYRAAGGAPEAVSTWSSFGGVQPYVTIDQASVDNAGGGGPWSHLRALPADGTFVSNTADGRVYRIAGGAPLYVSTYGPFGAGASVATTSLDPWEFGNYVHLRSVPNDVFLSGATTGRVFRVVSGGHAYYVNSWAPYGGGQPVVVVDDWAIDNCDHLACGPFGNYEGLTEVPGGAVASGWVMDPNSMSPVTVQVAVDGAPGRSDMAALPRPDVDAVFHRGAGYGYSSRVQLTTGTHQVCVTAVNLGAGPATSSLGCKNVTVAAGAIVGVTPSRVLDTRTGNGATAGPLAAGGTVALQVLGRGGLPPSGVSAVVVNLTATSSTTSGYLVAYPSGTARPTASTLNFSAHQTVPNLAMVAVGADGKIAITNGGAGTVHVVADISGYVVAGNATTPGAVTPVRPTRLLDTRSGPGAAPLAPSTGVSLPVLGQGPVPANGASAVVLNVTVVGAQAGGYLTVYPSGASRPQASNLNFGRAAAVANLVVVPVGADGRVVLFNSSPGTTHVIADVAGWVMAGAATTPGAATALVPARLLDTRFGTGAAVGAVPGNGTVHLSVLGRGGLPATGVSAVLLNVTVTAAAQAGYITVYPDGSSTPPSSNLNFVAGQTVANLVLVPVGPNGQVALKNTSPGAAHLVADVVGYSQE
ncbi:CHAP domain-containing protein [Dermatophilaceae bacterium Soc4.6]